MTNRLIVSRIADKASDVLQQQKNNNNENVNIILWRADNKLISEFPKGMYPANVAD